MISDVTPILASSSPGQLITVCRSSIIVEHLFIHYKFFSTSRTHPHRLYSSILIFCGAIHSLADIPYTHTSKPCWMATKVRGDHRNEVDSLLRRPFKKTLLIKCHSKVTYEHLVVLIDAGDFTWKLAEGIVEHGT